MKQLSLKFLQRSESMGEQESLLEPLERIYEESESGEVREFVVSCLIMLTNCCYLRLKSGWR